MAAAGPSSSSSLSVVPRPAHASPAPLAVAPAPSSSSHANASSPAPLAVAPAAKSSILGQGLSMEQRVCLLGLVALSLPQEDQALGRWNIVMLRTVARLLRLADGHWMALQPLLYSEGNDVASRKMQLEAFRRPFFPAAAPDPAVLVQEGSRVAEDMETKEQKSKALRILRDLLVHLACLGLYDARSRHVLMALSADGFALDWREVAKVEAFVAFLLHEKWAASHQKDKVNKYLRYAKIGAAALGGGALLAVTGGLAAPAISVGLAAMGTTAGAMVASVTTTATVATLFGASGAGLVGYKMKRRTEGIKQFELKHVRPPMSALPSLLGEAKRVGAARRRWRLQHRGQHQLGDMGEDVDEGAARSSSSGGGSSDADADTSRMVVCIMIAGWLRNDESEFDTPFGVEPSAADVAGRLRLFYLRHNRENLRFAAVLARDYEGREEELDAECRRKYGASPFDPLTAMNGPATTPALLAAIGEEEREAVLLLVEERTGGNNGGGDASPPMTSVAARRLGSSSLRGEASLLGGASSMSEADDAALAAELQRIVGFSSPAPSAPGVSQQRSIEESAADEQEGYAKGGAGEEEATLLEERPAGGGDVQRDAEAQRSKGPERSASETEALLALAGEDADMLAAEAQVPWWLETFPYLEAFTLHWESAALLDLGSSVMEVVASLGQQAALEVLTFTAAASLVSALAWPITLLQAADMIDGTWHIACEKADRAGQLLATVLMKKEHGHRPVVLVGFSMGARVIFACLQELERAHRAWEKEQEERQFRKAGAGEAEGAMGSPAAGLIHTVVLLGTPVSGAVAPWRRARAMVADRLINCYSRKDWVLSLMYRYQKLALSAAGIAPVSIPGVEDVDLTDVINGHQQYPSRIRECLLKVGLDDCFAPESPRRTDAPPSQSASSTTAAVPGAAAAAGVVGAEGQQQQQQQHRQADQGALDAATTLPGPLPQQGGRQQDVGAPGEPATILY